MDTFAHILLSYCICRIILCLFHEPISDNCALIAVRNCFFPGRECHQTSNFLPKPGNHFARGSSPVMMASINPNKALVKSALRSPPHHHHLHPLLLSFFLYIMRNTSFSVSFSFPYSASFFLAASLREPGDWD